MLIEIKGPPKPLKFWTKKLYMHLVNRLTRFMITVGFAVVVSHTLSAQKFEREQRVKSEDVPVEAVEFIQKWRGHAHMKWFLEESEQGYTWEAKTKYNRYRYSIEFDSTGGLQDVEMTISLSELEPNLQRAIHFSLERILDKPSIRKIQLQVSGEEATVLRSLKNNEYSSADNLRIQYEIIADGKVDGVKNRYEFTLSAQGDYVDHQQVIFRNTDNLEY